MQNLRVNGLSFIESLSSLIHMKLEIIQIDFRKEKGRN